jgi:hypothetical protein
VNKEENKASMIQIQIPNNTRVAGMVIMYEKLLRSCWTIEYS